MQKVIVFYGTKGSGKDTCYELLQKIQFFKFSSLVQKVSFADYLKEVVFRLFKTKIVDRDRIYGTIDKKEEEITDWKIPEDIKVKCGFTEDNWSGRRLLQWFGTDVCRNVYSDVWVDSLAENIESMTQANIIAITDCRFKNEYMKLKELGTKYEVIFIKIVRNEIQDNNFSTHSSEKDMADFEFDIEIDNSGTLIQLENTLTALSLADWKI